MRAFWGLSNLKGQQSTICMISENILNNLFKGYIMFISVSSFGIYVLESMLKWNWIARCDNFWMYLQFQILAAVASLGESRCQINYIILSILQIE